jgi:hypothetical protein
MWVKLNAYHWGLQWNSVVMLVKKMTFWRMGSGGKGRSENKWDVSGAGQPAPPEVRGWSEKFSASTITGTIGKIFPPKLVHLS